MHPLVFVIVMLVGAGIYKVRREEVTYTPSHQAAIQKDNERLAAITPESIHTSLPKPTKDYFANTPHAYPTEEQIQAAARKVCEIVHVRFDDKSVSDLTYNQIGMLHDCERLGY